MFQHPTIATAVAEQRRAAFMAEAETARLAREARTARHGGKGSATGPARWFASRRHPRHAATRRGLARLRPARAR